MADTARSFATARAIKLKLIGDDLDADRVRAVREARPDVWLGVDANQGFTRPFLDALMPVLVDARVSLIEQPFPVGIAHGSPGSHLRARYHGRQHARHFAGHGTGIFSGTTL